MPAQAAVTSRAIVPSGRYAQAPPGPPIAAKTIAVGRKLEGWYFTAKADTFVPVEASTAAT
jgi:hypothetical protein